MDMRGATCKGSIMIGSACGSCDKCKKEIRDLVEKYRMLIDTGNTPLRVTYDPCPVCGHEARHEHFMSGRSYFNCVGVECGSNGGGNFNGVMTRLALLVESGSGACAQ